MFSMCSTVMYKIPVILNLILCVSCKIDYKICVEIKKVKIYYIEVYGFYIFTKWNHEFQFGYPNYLSHRIWTMK